MYIFYSYSEWIRGLLCIVMRLLPHHSPANKFSSTTRIFSIGKPLTCWLIFFNFTLLLCRKVPSLLEYFSYLFHYSTILAGPVCTFREFNDFIDGSDIRPKVMCPIFEWHHIEMIASIWRENGLGHYLFRQTVSRV